MELRPYQIESIRQINTGLHEKGFKRQILCSPCGSGKTIVAGELLRKISDAGKKSLFIVDRTALVRQASSQFYDMGLSHGVQWAGHSHSPHQLVQVCSAQTLEARESYTQCDYVVIDEAHVQRKKIIDFVKTLGIPTIGLTATPFTKSLGETYEYIVNITSTNELLNTIDPDTGRPYLAPMKVYRCREIDMTGAPINNSGEWADKEVSQRGAKIIGDIVGEWEIKTRKEFGQHVKTLVYSADVAHGTQLKEEFRRRGHGFEQISYLQKDTDERDDIIRRFRNGEIIGLISCEALTRGFDVPDVLCLVAARPYRRSLASHIQQIGRLMRPSPGKEYGLLLDHCIEKSQRVLTKRGLVPIYKIYKDDLLWDGVEWVPHGGAVKVGVKKVITYAGLTATPEHRVKTRLGWMDFGEAARQQIPIVQTGFGGQAIRECESRFADGGMVGAEVRKTDARKMRMHDLRLSVDHPLFQSSARADEGVSLLQSTNTSLSKMALLPVQRDETKVHQSKRQAVLSLWSEGDRVQIRRSEGCHDVDHEQPWHTCGCEKDASGQNRQRRALRTGESALVYPDDQHVKSTDISKSAFSQVPHRTSRDSIRRFDVEKIDDDAYGRRDYRQVLQHEIPEAEGEVWDIRDAGPRNRFTCEGLLTHNSGNWIGHRDATMEFFANGARNLSYKKAREVRKEGEERTVYACPQCDLVPDYTDLNCRECGYAFPRKQAKSYGMSKGPEFAPGIMVEEDYTSKGSREWKYDKRWTWEQICNVTLDMCNTPETARRTAFTQYRTLYGEPPKWSFVIEHEDPPDTRVYRRVRKQLNEYRKSKKQREAVAA